MKYEVHITLKHLVFGYKTFDRDYMDFNHIVTILSFTYKKRTFFSFVWFRFMVFNATFNNISAIWRSVLFVEETGIPGESPRPAVSH